MRLASWWEPPLLIVTNAVGAAPVVCSEIKLEATARKGIGKDHDK
jgi:hypothetical protein